MSLVSIPAAHLRYVLPFKSKGDIRFYLDGIAVQPVESGGCMLIATDGHIMGAYHSMESRCDGNRVLTISEDLEKALAESPDDERTLTIENEKARAVLAGESFEVYVQAGPAFIDPGSSKYPDWRKVVPPIERLAAGTPAMLQARFLGLLSRCLPGEREVGARFSHDSKDPQTSVTVIRLEKAPGLVIFLMPMKEKMEFVWPDWMPHEQTKEVTA